MLDRVYRCKIGVDLQRGKSFVSLRLVQMDVHSRVWRWYDIISICTDIELKNRPHIVSKYQSKIFSIPCRIISKFRSLIILLHPVMVIRLLSLFFVHHSYIHFHRSFRSSFPPPSNVIWANEPLVLADYFFKGGEILLNGINAYFRMASNGVGRSRKVFPSLVFCWISLFDGLPKEEKVEIFFRIIDDFLGWVMENVIEKSRGISFK